MEEARSEASTLSVGEIDELQDLLETYRDDVNPSVVREFGVELSSIFGLFVVLGYVLGATGGNTRMATFASLAAVDVIDGGRTVAAVYDEIASGLDESDD